MEIFMDENTDDIIFLNRFIICILVCHTWLNLQITIPILPLIKIILLDRGINSYF